MMSIPKGTPRKLAAVIKHHDGKYHHIAQELGVNVYHIHRYITHGQEPRSNSIRAKMFLPIKNRKSRAGQPIPEHIKIWRHLPSDTRNALIKQALQEIGQLPMSKLQDLLLSMLVETDANENGQSKRKLERGLHVTIHANSRNYKVWISRDDTHPSPKEWETIFRHWPYYITIPDAEEGKDPDNRLALHSIIPKRHLKQLTFATDDRADTAYRSSD